MAPRFGIWAAVHGSRAAHHDPDEPDDARWTRNRALVLEAEALRADTRARTDAASVMFAKTDAAATRHVGTNGGTAAGVVGSYETVAARIRAFHATGIELFMLQFQPFEAEMRRFAEHVLPRAR